MDHLTADLTELVEGFLAGYSSAATRAAYRSDLSLWSGHRAFQVGGVSWARQ